MTLGDRLRTLRVDLGLTQEAIGAQGFVSAPGWIKLENRQRQASERLIDSLIRWLVADKYIKSSAAAVLREELLALKYMGSRSKFLSDLATKHAKTLPAGAALTAAEDPEIYKLRHRRGRPPKINR